MLASNVSEEGREGGGWNLFSREDREEGASQESVKREEEEES